MKKFISIMVLFSACNSFADICIVTGNNFDDPPSRVIIDCGNRSNSYSVKSSDLPGRYVVPVTAEYAVVLTRLAEQGYKIVSETGKMWTLSK